MIVRVLALWAVVAASLLGGAARGQNGAAPSLLHTDLIKRGDTALWLGDELIERADWPRFVVAGLLMSRPDDGVSWRRAGTRDSSAQVAGLWGARVAMSVRASLVFACFGHAESEYLRHPMPPGFPEPTDADLERALDAYEDGLELFVNAMLSRSVRTVVIVSPSAVDELEPTSRGFYVGVNATLERMAERARAFAERRSLPFIDLYAITAPLYERARGDGLRATLDGRTPTEEVSTAIAAEVLSVMGVDRGALGRRKWRPCSEPAYAAARRIDPTLAPLSEGEGSGSFAVAQGLRVFDSHFEILWRHLDQNLHPDHANRADILSKHRAEVDADWRRVRVLVEEKRVLRDDEGS